MEVTLLGTRSPVPTTERGGTGLLVSIGDEPIFVDFASGADLLVQDASIAPVTNDPPETEILPDRVTRPLSEEAVRKHKQNHCDPVDAGDIAAKASVGTLVLTHLLPHRDLATMRERAESMFDGEVIVGEDNLAVTP